MAVASHYGLTLADISTLKLWELNYLVEEMQKDSPSAPRSRRYPPGSTPVMT